jgi:hypothetical protein
VYILTVPEAFGVEGLTTVVPVIIQGNGLTLGVIVTLGVILTLGVMLGVILTLGVIVILGVILTEGLTLTLGDGYTGVQGVNDPVVYVILFTGFADVSISCMSEI